MQDVLHMDTRKDTPTPWKTFTFMFVSKLKCLNWIFMCRFAIHLINVYKERHLWSVWAQFCSNTNSHSGKNVSFKILFPENVNSYPPSNSYICVSCQQWAGKNLCKIIKQILILSELCSQASLSRGIWNCSTEGMTSWHTESVISSLTCTVSSK